MKAYKDILVGYGIAILAILVLFAMSIGIKKTEPSVTSENANRFTTEKVTYNGSTGYLITDTKTGAEYLSFYHGSTIKLEKDTD